MTNPSINNPKTIIVKSHEHDGQEIRINEEDFNEEKHEKISKKPKLMEIEEEDDESKE